MINKTLLKTAASSLAIMTSCFVLTTANASAASATYKATTKNTKSIAIEDLDYDLKDAYETIEIDFLKNMKLKSTAAITVKDSQGTSYKTSVHEHDRDDLSLSVAGMKAGKTYTVKIKGIKNATASKYGTLTIKFSVPKKSTAVKSVEYDADDREVSFDFTNRVSYNNPKVVITSKDGAKNYTATIVEKDNDELTVRVKGLTYGKTYSYKITGVGANASSTSKTLQGTFVAIDN